MTHICVGKTTIIGSDNGLSPGRRQAIIWTNAGILLIGTSGTNFSDNLIECHSFSFKKMHMKMSTGNWRPSCLGLNVLNHIIKKGPGLSPIRKHTYNILTSNMLRKYKIQCIYVIYVRSRIWTHQNQWYEAVAPAKNNISNIIFRFRWKRI